MSTGFYELLAVAPEADLAAVRAAYQEQVAQAVRRLRAAESRQQDTATLEARRTALVEAFAVLSDPARRRRYDRFRELSRSGLPADLDELWRVAAPSMVDPAAAAALDVVRTLTGLKVGDAFGGPEATPEPETERTVPASQALGANPGAAALSAEAIAPLPKRHQAVFDRSLAPEEMGRILDAHGATGAWLRAAREARKMSLDELSEATKVTRRFLEAMEKEEWGSLPASTFVRGYLRVVMRTLELAPLAEEADEAVQTYMTRCNRARG